ncbi:MAG: UDP-N-acetylmuramate--L-alanine ligase [Firmicutes bacterium]|nr:UDP-N-acetylmuramate--L-alanine ligase [Bacillota bacterium]
MFDLKQYKNIHAIGIGGIGLSAICEILLSRGYNVSGSDMKESEMTNKLAQMGARVFLGHRAENVENADLLLYTAAIGPDNPELVRAKERGIPCLSRAEMLGHLMNEYENSIAISGTHGKTTTTSMVALIMENAGLDPTILVGGNLGEIGGNCQVGSSPYFVTEACEYVDSFLSLKPKIEIILNIDSDHLDYFKDINQIVRSFDKFASLVPEDGMIIAYDANPFVNQVTDGLKNVVTFGLNENCDYSGKNILFDENGMPGFDVYHKGEFAAHVDLSVPGEHNVLNALAAFACTHELGVGEDVIAETLHNYSGTERRFDIIGTTDKGVKIIDDYAHHPTEIKATLSATKNVPHNELWVCFQPHTYTRTLALFDEFADAFVESDHLVLAEIYAAREKNIYKVSSGQLMEKIREKHPEMDVTYIDNFEDMADYIRANAKKGDMVITMGAGDIYKVGDLLLE